MSNKFLLISVFITFKVFSQDISKNIRINKILAVEICRQDEFNPCSNYLSSVDTRNPVFYGVSKNGEIDYNTIYKIPYPNSDMLDQENSFELYEAAFNEEPKTTVLNVCLSKRQTNRIKRYIKKYKRKFDNAINLSFDGCINYNLYSLDFECVYKGKSSINTINTDGKDLLKSMQVDVYYIKRVYSLSILSP